MNSCSSSRSTRSVSPGLRSAGGRSCKNEPPANPAPTTTMRAPVGKTFASLSCSVTLSFLLPFGGEYSPRTHFVTQEYLQMLYKTTLAVVDSMPRTGLGVTGPVEKGDL
jgi:hypothetical protein